ncbi:MAG: hypothetical protein AAGG07_04675 [Planctomycetota bacterium]
MADSESMSRNEVWRLLAGVAFLIAVGSVIAIGWATRERVSSVESTHQLAVVENAQERGLDLDSGTPTEVVGRIRALIDAGAAIDRSAVESRGGVWVRVSDGTPATGHIYRLREDGSLEGSFGVLDGRLAGMAFVLNPDGSIVRAFRYLDGRVAGQYIEYYSNGAMMLRMVAGPPTERGGTSVTEVTLDQPAGSGLQRTQFPAGRLQFLTPAGSTRGENESIDPLDVSGFMLFEYRPFGTERQVVSDSRDLNRALPDG